VPESKFSVVRLVIGNNKFEILVRPDPALEFKLGKKYDLSSVLVSDEIYTDANKGSRAGNDKLSKYFKTTDSMEIAKQILLRGEHSLTTEQRRRMTEEKKKQIVQFINKNFVDPRTHLPHPPLRIASAMNEVRIVIDPYKRAEDQVKGVIDAVRKILPLKSENVILTITVPSVCAVQSYSTLKSIGSLKGEQWLADGSLKILVETNAGMKGEILERIGSITKGTALISEQ
ncbi:MAG TPA: ribosome assembly factor SBDS, partial [Nitrososphaera sp.]|jgi:ribosome maturation protein SDO1